MPIESTIKITEIKIHKYGSILNVSEDLIEDNCRIAGKASGRCRLTYG